MSVPPQYPLARQSAGVAPLRRPCSIRRTTSIDTIWPDGPGKPSRMEATGRDILTPSENAQPRILGQAHYRMLVSTRREILEIATTPPVPQICQLVGVRAGGESRARIAAIIGDRLGSPLYQILDDFAGASLVAQWIWSQWLDDWEAYVKSVAQHNDNGRKGRMLDICTGFAEGSSALGDDGGAAPSFHDQATVGPLENPDDPAGWHVLPAQSGPAMRRARRIDLWREGNLLIVDAGFQDSGSVPSGGRRGVHEYRVHAEIDARTGVLLALQALPLILPFPECPGASVKAARMVGKKVEDFRDTVLEVLPGTLGCTHLNDVLRGLADVPSLARALVQPEVLEDR